MGKRWEGLFVPQDDGWLGSLFVVVFVVVARSNSVVGASAFVRLFVVGKKGIGKGPLSTHRVFAGGR